MHAEAPGRATLSGRQKRFLRSLGQRLEAVIQVGDAGITEGVRRALDDALRAHELVKVRMRQPDDKKAMARALAETSGAEMLLLIGHTAVLYRANADEPRIELPA